MNCKMLIRKIKLKTFTLGLLMMFSCSLFAQEKQDMKRSIGFTLSPVGHNDVVNSARASMEGEASYDGYNFYTLGISYVHPIRSWIDLEAGIEYSNHTFRITPMSIPPDRESNPYDRDIFLMNIPITARINFLKHFFFNSGIMFGFDTGDSGPIDDQTGIGALLGIGAKYNLNKRFGIFANWNYKFYSLIPFSSDNDDHRWRLVEGALRIGLTYGF